ncbi:MAG: hypothetical protein MJ172_10675 [Clostridia bacterium]|nr:hypothetical protein [Clostridia bacterium]
MIAIFNNIKRSVCQHTTANLLILINIILSTAAIFVLLQNYYYLRQQYNEQYGTTNVAKNYYVSINDIDQLQSYHNDLDNKSPMYYVKEKIVDELIKKYDFKFYFYCESSLWPEDLENEELWTDYLLYEEFGDYYYIVTYLMDKNAVETHNFNLSEGVLFDEKDYTSQDMSTPMNVVMGSNYSKIFNVGDTFKCGEDTARIIGFLEEGSSLNVYGYREVLDDRMIFPQIFPRYMDEDSILPDDFMYLYSPNEDVDVQEAINTVTTKCGYYTLTVSPIDGIQLTSTKDISEKNVKLIGILALIACTICALSLASILVNRTLQDRDVYCIYLCCGIPMWKINLSIAIEMMIYLVISIFPTVAISIREYGSLIVPLWQILLFAGSITVISLIPTFITNRKCNIDLMIRDRIV